MTVHSPPALTPIIFLFHFFHTPLQLLVTLHHRSTTSVHGATVVQPAAVFEDNYDLPTPESYLSPTGQHQKVKQREKVFPFPTHELIVRKLI